MKTPEEVFNDFVNIRTVGTEIAGNIVEAIKTYHDQFKTNWRYAEKELPINKNWILIQWPNNRRQIAGYHPIYKHWVNEDGNKISGISKWTELP